MARTIDLGAVKRQVTLVKRKQGKQQKHRQAKQPDTDDFVGASLGGFCSRLLARHASRNQTRKTGIIQTQTGGEGALAGFGAGIRISDAQLEIHATFPTNKSGLKRWGGDTLQA